MCQALHLWCFTSCAQAPFLLISGPRTGRRLCLGGSLSLSPHQFCSGLDSSSRAHHQGAHHEWQRPSCRSGSAEGLEALSKEPGTKTSQIVDCSTSELGLEYTFRLGPEELEEAILETVNWSPSWGPNHELEPFLAVAINKPS